MRRRLGFGATRGRRALAAALALVARLAAPAIAIVLLRGALSQAELLGPTAEVVADHIASGLVSFAIGYAIAGAWFSPGTPALRLSSLDDAAAMRGFRRSTLLALTMGLNVAVVRAGEALDLSPASLAVGAFGVMLLGAAAMWRLADVLSPTPGPETSGASGEAAAEGDEDPGFTHQDEDPLAESLQSAATVGRRLEGLGAFSLRAAAVVALALSAAGYYAAAQRLFYPAAATLGIVGAGLILFSLIREWVEAALENRTADSGGLRLLTVLFGFVITLASLPVLALVWGARTADIGEAWRMASSGVDVGGATLTPMVFVTFGVVFALDAKSGEILWSERIGIPMRVPPTVRGGRLFVVTVDNNLIALDTRDGKTLWTHAGAQETASLLGGASPAEDAGIVVVPYTSGELFALRVDTGRVIWQENLASIRRTDAVASLAHIRGRPIIDRGRVIAISHAGVMAAKSGVPKALGSPATSSLRSPTKMNLLAYRGKTAQYVGCAVYRASKTRKTVKIRSHGRARFWLATD